MANIEEVYQKIVNKINDQTINATEFNTLLEALPKSTKERLLRRTRTTNPGPASKSVVGQTVPKREGDNDPRKGRGTRYKSGKPAKERQNEKQKQEYHKQAAHVKIESIIREDKKIYCPFCETHIENQTQLTIKDKDIYHLSCEKGSAQPIIIPEAILKSLLQYPLSEQLEIEGALKEQKDKEKETRTYTATAKPNQLDEFEKLLRWVDACCSMGHSGTAEISVDGDGAAKIKIEGLKPSTDKLPEPPPKGPELTVSIT